MLEKVVRIYGQQDTFAAIEEIRAQGEPLDVAKVYAQLVQDLYHQQKDVPLMLMIGRDGVQYCLAEAARCGDAKQAKNLRGMAKMMSFNLSVNCWPAWEDEGIALTAADIRSGYDLARLNLRLAHELQRDADKLANAQWLLGAHQLYAKETDAAIESFQKAAELSAQAEQPAGQQMALGYAAIAKQTLAATKDEGGRELAAAVKKLRELDTDDSRFFADQLKSVSSFFSDQY